MKKKLLSLMVIMSLVVSMTLGVTGCGSKSSDSDNGVWSHNSRLHPNTLQLKLGLLCDDAFMDELFEKMDKGLAQALSK